MGEHCPDWGADGTSQVAYHGVYRNHKIQIRNDGGRIYERALRGFQIRYPNSLCTRGLNI